MIRESPYRLDERAEGQARQTLRDMLRDLLERAPQGARARDRPHKGKKRYAIPDGLVEDLLGEPRPVVHSINRVVDAPKRDKAINPTSKEVAGYTQLDEDVSVALSRGGGGRGSGNGSGSGKGVREMIGAVLRDAGRGLQAALSQRPRDGTGFGACAALETHGDDAVMTTRSRCGRYGSNVNELILIF